MCVDRPFRRVQLNSEFDVVGVGAILTHDRVRKPVPVVPWLSYDAKSCCHLDVTALLQVIGVDEHRSYIVRVLVDCSSQRVPVVHGAYMYKNGNLVLTMRSDHDMIVDTMDAPLSDADIARMAEDPEVRPKLREFAMSILRAIAPKGLQDELSLKERAFVAEFFKHWNREKALRDSGVGWTRDRIIHVFHGERTDPVAKAINDAMIRREEESVLQGEWVRAYIKSVLLLKPTDFLEEDEDGFFVTTKEKIDSMPDELKMLVESVEVTFHKGRKLLKLCFVSKTAALALAAKYTLTQKARVEFAQPINYEAIGESIDADDPIERRISELETVPAET